MVRREQIQIVGVVGEDHASPEPDGRGDDEGVDGHVTASTGSGQKVAGNPRDAQPCGDHGRIAATELLVNRLVEPGAAVEFHKNSRGHSHRVTSAGGRAQGSANL
jgi:hypothetical protein